MTSVAALAWLLRSLAVRFLPDVESSRPNPGGREHASQARSRPSQSRDSQLCVMESTTEQGKPSRSLR
jgi:hypothetical protein